MINKCINNFGQIKFPVFANQQLVKAAVSSLIFPVVTAVNSIAFFINWNNRAFKQRNKIATGLPYKQPAGIAYHCKHFPIHFFQLQDQSRLFAYLPAKRGLSIIQFEHLNLIS